jgi:F-type H+-transporting ATPase subunit alpha
MEGLLITAVPMARDIVAKIESKFSEKMGFPVHLSVEVDPSLIAGFVVSSSTTLRLLRQGAALGHQKAFAQRLTHHRPKGDGSWRVTEIHRGSQESVRNYPGDVSMRREGTVVCSGDGIVTHDGLLECKYGELLEFENDVHGIALNMEKDFVGAVLVDNAAQVREGSAVLGSERVMEVPVGDELLGRVVNPLGHPMDNRGRIRTEHFRPIESEAPRIIDREKVSEPLQTGLIAIDAMIPIGKGQRELIIGDRQTGENRHRRRRHPQSKEDKNVICVYVAIGQKASTIARIAKLFEDSGAAEYCVVVAATASDSAPMQYIAPYAGCAIAEDFMLRGRDVLIVYDDLSKHAVAYRAMSLLLRRPPDGKPIRRRVLPAFEIVGTGGQAVARQGGGSMTALPIVETMAGDISAYIPTQRHLDHRRADFPGERAFLLGRPPGGQRRPVGVQGGRLGPDQGHAAGFKPASAGAGAVSGNGGFRAVFL